MPRKKKKCLEIDCENQTHGDRCYFHAKEKLTKHKNKREYKRDWIYKKKYNISSEEFDFIMQLQHNKCAICKCEVTYPKNKRGIEPNTAVLDHDHKTGNIRGILCRNCNSGLGFFSDSIDKLNSAKEYLK